MGITRGGGLVRAKSPKLSCQGSVLPNETWGASVLGRGDLGGARKAKLREGVGGSLAGIQTRIWFDSPIPSQSSLFFPTLYSLLPSLILYSNFLESSGGLCTDGMWWWVVVEEKRLVAACPIRPITSQTYRVFNSIAVYLPRSTLHKSFKLLKKIYIYIRYVLECL